MTQPATGTFSDHTLPVADRVADLLGRLTVGEKIALLHQHQAAIPRLGIGAFRTGTEALHGLAWLGRATVFPQAIGLASTWDSDLVRAVGSAVGDEVRGSHRANPAGAGLNVWAPVVNLLRDPRWGRNEEGYSEDPLLTALMGTSYSWGLRGDHPTYLRTAPTLKHFLAYNNETDRDVTSSVLGPRVLQEYELPAFRDAISSGAAVSIMASYNLVNGRPAHVSPLINSQVRTWTKDEVLVVSDAGGPSLLAGRQAYYPDHVTGTAGAVRAGLDSFTEIGPDPTVVIDRLTKALEHGYLSESDIDQAARRALSIRFRLGEFDPAEANPFAAIPAETVDCEAHRRLARQAAARSVVLLKNDNQTLPLRAGAGRRIAVLGPLADAVYTDWYSGTPPYRVSVRDALVARLGDSQVTHVEGVDHVALREPSTGRYICLAEDGSLRLETIDAPENGAEGGLARPGFDLFDWGRGVFSLRAGNGQVVTVNDTGGLIADQEEPNGWVVRETFTFDGGHSDCVRLISKATGLPVVADDDGRLFLAETADCGEAEPGTAGGTALGGSAAAIVGGASGQAVALTVELLRDGVVTASEAATGADVAVVVVGNHPLVNGRETEDRVDLELPAAQQALVRAVRAANPHTILVITSSYPYGISWENEHIPAIVWSSHGGQELGNGVTDVLLGEVDPSGRLPQTWYHSATDLPDILDYDIISDDLTYLYYRGTPLFPFGHGLSYTSFQYSDLRLSTSTVDPTGRTANESVTVTVTVTNTGSRAGTEVVQLYTRQRSSRVKCPLRQLRGFERVELAPGARATVNFSLAAKTLRIWDVTQNRFVVESANHYVMVGSSSQVLHLSKKLTVRNETIPPRNALRAIFPATSHDEYAGTTLVPESRALGEAVESAEPGSWVAFREVDFGSGASTATARVRWTSRQRADSATLTLKLDNPLDGPVVGTIAVPNTGSQYRWVDVPIALAGATGFRDLYAVFSAPGVALSTLSFGVL